MFLCSNRIMDMKILVTDREGNNHILKGDISKTGVHKQCGISLTTPPLLKKCLTEKFKVSPQITFLHHVGGVVTPDRKNRGSQIGILGIRKPQNVLRVKSRVTRKLRVSKIKAISKFPNQFIYYRNPSTTVLVV